MLALSKLKAVFLALILIISSSCGKEEGEGKEIRQEISQPTSYIGPPLSMPLPPGIQWKVNTNPGFWSPEVLFHSGVHHHAIDFGDNFYIGEQFFDEGDGVIDILAAADGTITRVVEAPNCSSGGGTACKVYVNHSGAERSVGYETEYTHLTPGSIVVSLGQKVRRGQKLGKLGWSGTQSPHLHFQLRYNNDSSEGNPALAGVRLEAIPFVSYALDKRYPSTNTLTFSKSASNPQLCANEPTGSAATNWVYTCTPKTGTIKVKEPVWGLIGIEKIAHEFGWKAEVWHTDDQTKAVRLVTTYQWNSTGVDPWGWDRSYYWPWVYPDKPGSWEIRYYVRTTDAFPSYPIATLPFKVADTPPYTYNGNGTTCARAPSGSAATNWVYSCDLVSTFAFSQNPTVYGMLYVENIFRNYKFVTKFYKDGLLIWVDDPGIYTVVEPWVWRYGYAFPQIQRPQPGNWRIEVNLLFADGTPSVKLRDIAFTVRP